MIRKFLIFFRTFRIFSYFRMAVLALVFFVLSYIFVFSYVKAAGVDFGISESIFDISALPGYAQYELITLTNKNSSALPIHIQTVPWNFNSQTEDIEFKEVEPALNAANWFLFYQTPKIQYQYQLQNIDPGRDLKDIRPITDLILLPKSSQTILLEIKPPVSAALGSYQVMARFQPALPQFYFQENATQVYPEIGALFFIKIPCLAIDQNSEQCRYRAQINDFSAGNSFHQQRLFEKIMGLFLGSSVAAGIFDQKINDLSFQIENTGLFHFRLAGYAEISNLFGKALMRVPLPDKIIPSQRSRTISLIFRDASKSKPLYKHVSSWFADQLYFGPYKASIFLTLPSPSEFSLKPLSKEISFWVIPWKFWTTIIILIIAMVYIFRKYNRRIKAALKILVKTSV